MAAALSNELEAGMELKQKEEGAHSASMLLVTLAPSASWLP
jgi:hypothetical protein